MEIVCPEEQRGFSSDHPRFFFEGLGGAREKPSSQRNGEYRERKVRTGPAHVGDSQDLGGAALDTERRELMADKMRKLAESGGARRPSGARSVGKAG